MKKPISKLQSNLRSYFVSITKEKNMNKYQISRICKMDITTYEKIIKQIPISDRKLIEIKSYRSVFIDDLTSDFIDVCK